MNELSKSSISELSTNISSLTRREALALEAKILGYRKMPVTIRQFVNDEYYLGRTWKGKLYEYWFSVLEKIFPDEIHLNYTFVVFTGPLGGGKSTVMGIAQLYIYYRLTLLTNFDYFGVNLTKTIDFTFFHLSAGDADTVLIQPIFTWMGESPYFQGEGAWTGQFQFNPEGLRSDHSTGHDVIGYIFSEISFNDYERTRFRIDQAQDRLKSRFIKVLDYFGLIGLDSSAKDEGSLTEDLIKEYSSYMKILVVRDPIWVIKESTGAYFNTLNKYGELSFKVYCGDGVHEPFVMDHGQVLDSEYDPDKIIEVPNEFYPNFRSNCTLALQNDAGIGTGIADTFIADKVALSKSYCIPNHIAEVVLVDFYDEEQLIDHVRAQILKEVPEEKVLSIAIDMGVSGDLCGFAASYMEDYVRDKAGKPTTEIYTRTPLAVGISRKVGQETRISKLFNLIKAISELREVMLVTTDGYQSTQIRQDVDANLQIWCYLASVDRTKDAYIFYKTQVYKGYQKTVNHKRLLSSQLALQDVGYKIDHPDDNEKDISDAVVSSVYNISLYPEAFMQLSKIYTTKVQMKVLTDFNFNPEDEINEFLTNRTF